MTLNKEALGAHPGQALTHSELFIIATVGEELYVETADGEREVWVKRDSRPSCYALYVDGHWYEFAHSLSMKEVLA